MFTESAETFEPDEPPSGGPGSPNEPARGRSRGPTSLQRSRGLRLIAIVAGVAIIFAAIVLTGVVHIPGLPSLTSPSGGGPKSDSVSFVESGLPRGQSWAVLLGSAWGSSNTSTIEFHATAGAYAWIVSALSGYTPTPGSGNLTLGSSSNTVNVSFVGADGPFPLSFEETGLPSGSSWNVTLVGESLSPVTQSSGTASISFLEPAGTYAYTVASAAGYAASPAAGTVTASLGVSAIEIAFAPPAPGHLVGFEETGLAHDLSWSVTIDERSTAASTSSSITFTEANGTYVYTVGAPAGWSAAPADGLLVVSGSPTTVAIVFSAAATTGYPVEFTETGLAAGQSWSVSTVGLSGAVTENSTGTSVTFRLANGTYGYAVLPVAGYNATPEAGFLDVAGAALVEPIVFAGGSNTSAAEEYDYVQAAALMSTAAQGYEGESWSVIEGTGVATGTPYVATSSEIASGLAPNCSYAYVDGADQVVTLESTPTANASQGEATSWLFVLKSGDASDGILFGLVSRTNGTLLFTATGGDCELASLLSAVPASVIGSADAVSIADSSGGSAFLAGNATALRIFAIVGGSPLSDPTWEITYSTCQFTLSGSGTGTSFTAEINADSGALVNTESSSSCSESTAL